MLVYHRKKLEIEPFFRHEPWKITEETFDSKSNLRNESIFSIGNGYMGVRGNLEEDYTGAPGSSIPGVYINGVYAAEQIIYGEAAPHQPEKSQTIVNLANWLKINLYIDNEKFDMLEGKIEGYRRELNLKEGILRRSLVWISPSKKRIGIDIERFVSFTDVHIGLIRYNIKALNFQGNVKLVSEIDGNVRNYIHLRDPYHLRVIEKGYADDLGFILQRVDSTDISIAMAMAHELTGCEGTVDEFKLSEDKRVMQEYDFEISPGQDISLKKYICFFTDQDKPGACINKEQLKNLSIESVKKARNTGYQVLYKEHANYLQEYWEDVDVVIEGASDLQQAFRFNALQLLQSTGRNGNTTTAAKGLTGESYEGHFFWDTEMYILPFFIYTQPEIARKILLYRYNTLPQARENARRVKVDGALYPWRTINGEEASAFFMGSTVQFHINADIAYAIYKYFTATEDYEFLFKYGLEILVETARMWASRGSYIPLKGNKYCFNEVCGPDEYKPGVSNNCYTNYMARFNLEYAVKVLEILRGKDPARYSKFRDKMRITDREISKWGKIAADIYLPYNEQKGIHPQDDSFLETDPIDINSIL